MSWQRLSAIVPRDSAGRLECALAALGAAAVSLVDAADEPIYEPPPGEMPLWQQTRVEGLFAAGVDWQRVLAEVHTIAGPGVQWRREIVADQVWERVWMDRFRPLSFGDRLWIYPSNHAVPEGLSTVVRLDPGLAFGTGTHATTALCLEALDEHVRGPLRVVDFGCGSGVLALAALVLGATHAYAHDIDPQALPATAENARRNGLSERLSVVARAEALAPVRPQLLVANILAAPLIALADHLAMMMPAGSRLILSGVLSHQAAAVRSAYEGTFTGFAERQRDGWVCLQGTRR